MGFWDFLRVKKAKKEKATLKETAERTEPQESDDALKQSPYEYDTALFDRFYRDLENNALPVIPDPTQAEIQAYKATRMSLKFDCGPLSDSVDPEKLEENHSIPVEVDIWVDKVFNSYFADLKPMMGLVHRCQGAKKLLYKYKGYTWHSISELYPTVDFD